MDRDKTILELDEFKRRARWKDDTSDVLVRKRMNVETKVQDSEKRILDFISSTEKRDRDGDIINSAGWDLSNFNKNPILLFGHQYDKPACGRVISSQITDNALKQTVQFIGEDVADGKEYSDWPEWLKFCDLLYKLYSKGYMRAVSVGFEPKSWEYADAEEGNINFHEQELLELSLVTVPSNPQAVQAAGVKGRDKQLIKDYLNKAKSLIDDDEEVIEIVEEEIEIVEEKINLDDIEYKEEYIWIDGVKMTKSELQEMINKAVAEQVKKKTGKVL